MVNLSEKASFVKIVFGAGELSRGGTDIAVKCPNKECKSRIEGKKKYSIQLETDQSHCWVCGLKTRDSLIPTLRKFGLTSFLNEYIEKFQPTRKKRYLLDQAETNESEDKIDFPASFKLLAQNLDSRDPNVLAALNYLSHRGLSERDLWYFKLGIADDRKFWRRIIMPSFDKEGCINFYTTRKIDDNTKFKYMNSSADKVSIIFNEHVIDWNETLTIVEGPFDLMKCDENATCLQGSGLTEDYLLFWRIVYNKTPVILALDPDAIKKTHKYATLLSSYDINVKILDVGHFKDVGSMSKKDFLEAKNAASDWNRIDALKCKIDNMRLRENKTQKGHFNA